jgi:hypothetical protein
MLNPALRPEHASLLTFPSTGRLPSAISAADISRLCCVPGMLISSEVKVLYPT